MSGTALSPSPAPTPGAGQNPLMQPQGPQPQQQGQSLGDVTNMLSGANLTPQAVQQHLSVLDYKTAALGALSKKPDLTPKDVVSATAGAVAQGHMTTDEAVKFLTSMPPNPRDLSGWVQQKYRDNLTGVVALRSVAAKMRGAPQ